MNRLTTALLSLVLFCLPACEVDPAEILYAPEIASTSPSSAAVLVPRASTIVVNFNVAMDPESINATTFTLKRGASNVAATVTLDSAMDTATLTPGNPLESGSAYTASVSSGVRSSQGIALGQDYTWGFTVAATATSVGDAPAVTDTTPLPDAIDVSAASTVSATFSNTMTRATLDTTTFTLETAGIPVPGTVSYETATRIATFTPLALLQLSQRYTATITTGAVDSLGVALAVNHTWSFTISDTPVVIVDPPPTVLDTVPAIDAPAVAISSVVSATFSEAIDAATITDLTFTLSDGVNAVDGTVSYVDGTQTAIFTPAASLAFGQTYTATLSTLITDAAGVALAADVSWSFTTVGLPTPIAPTIVMATPLLSAPYISVNAKARATFSTDMAPGSFTELTFLLFQGSTPVSGTVTFDEPNNIAVFTPQGGLEPALPYTAILTTQVTDLSGTPLAADYSWSFTTDCSELVIDLGDAASFAVLAGTTITNTGPTTIVGDLGLSPGATITGFGPGTVIGTTHAADSTASLAQVALTLAYNDAAGRVSLCLNDVSALDLGGQTLTPGLYKDTGAMQLSGDLTLDALGDPDAVFLFQAGSTLTTTGNSQVILSNGAKAENVYWQIGSSATFATNTSMVGSVIALTSLTLNANTNLVGQVLARNGTVSMDTNDISLPAVAP